MLYFVAVGNVRGFAFTLGLTAIADLIVVFMFTHPTLQLLARTKFFGEGHRALRAGPEEPRRRPLVPGRGPVPHPCGQAGPVAALRAKNTGAAAEAERRMTIAERRLAERQEQLAGSSKSASKEGN